MARRIPVHAGLQNGKILRYSGGCVQPGRQEGQSVRRSPNDDVVGALKTNVTACPKKNYPMVVGGPGKGGSRQSACSTEQPGHSEGPCEPTHLFALLVYLSLD